MKQRLAAPRADSRETADRLEAFAALLLTWNRKINLISRADEAVLWERHINNSLELLPLLPHDFDHAIDLGSGAGFPGLILAIATGRPFDLIEADHRKAAFLREAARITAAPARVHTARAETVAIPCAPLITARAVATLPVLLDWACPLLASGGVCVFPKGRRAAEELTLAAAGWHMRVETFPSTSDPEARILRLSEIQRV